MTPGVLAGSLDPSPAEAESSLRRELLKPEYYQDNWVLRLFDWLARQLDRGMDAAVAFPAASTFAAMLIAILLVGGLVWLASRAQRSVRAPRANSFVVTDEPVSAADLRARAEEALAEGRTEDAVADGFRALAIRQVERGRLEDTPGTTAQEAARALAEEYPGLGERVGGSAKLFDAVIYGDRPATRDQAVDVLELDEELGSRR